MNNKHKDIGDNEIRIISSAGEGERARRPSHRRVRRLVVVSAIIAFIIAAGIAASLLFVSENEDADEIRLIEEATAATEPATAADEQPGVKGYTTVRDTLAGTAELCILTPHNATPVLEIGTAALSDTTVVLAVQAADVRGDNGEIVGTYVVNGRLYGKGESKAGFCSIVNGDITVGVADATPMLEEALTADGYFFRQYPLVVGGQIVENKPKGRAIRKALAELDGRISVITSRRRLTFHEFSQALTDMGVRNAIYLVGGTSSGRYTDEPGNRYMVGNDPGDKWPNVNYIVWR
ncbi:MAG: phosphodiester glycosidase family protein [Muribaculaceae bacterium]|nr:phosphodiester glycosidase family protein [Muribaculaceae bacterium]